MKLTVQEIEHVANLARLELTPEEKEKMMKDLAAIIDFADKLSEVNTDGIEPTAHILDMKNVFRKDETRPSYDVTDIIRNAPESTDNCIKVPKVVE
ncbi:MAG: Asp-tRNA(Asn)/Glu-tRNA(Gln) amidotransferase subunit GatC [Deltaproteobacteria bacterium]